jgi:hypothetical protein
MLAAMLYSLPTPHLYIVTVGALGVTLALVQGLLLPPPLHHERRDWMIYGFIGALGGTAVLWGADWYLDDIIGGAGYGLVVGVMGWAIVRDSIDRAWRWIPLNVFAYAGVALMVLITKTLNRLFRAYDNTIPLSLLIGLLAIAAFGYAALSGWGLWRLVYHEKDTPSA